MSCHGLVCERMITPDDSFVFVSQSRRRFARMSCLPDVGGNNIIFESDRARASRRKKNRYSTE